MLCHTHWLTGGGFPGLSHPVLNHPIDKAVGAAIQLQSHAGSFAELFTSHFSVQPQNPVTASITLLRVLFGVQDPVYQPSNVPGDTSRPDAVQHRPAIPPIQLI